jgi:hypothetical protein
MGLARTSAGHAHAVDAVLHAEEPLLAEACKASECSVGWDQGCRRMQWLPATAVR